MPILANHRKAAARSTRTRSISSADNRSLSNFGALITVMADLHLAQSSLRPLPFWVNPDWRLDWGQRRFSLNQIRGPFGDHDGGGIRVSADDRRHDRGVHHSQPAQAVDAQLVVYDCRAIGSDTHLAGADRMIAGLDGLPYPSIDLVCIAYLRSRKQLLAAIGIKRRLRQHFSQQLHAY